MPCSMSLGINKQKMQITTGLSNGITYLGMIYVAIDFYLGYRAWGFPCAQSPWYLDTGLPMVQSQNVLLNRKLKEIFSPVILARTLTDSSFHYADTRHLRLWELHQPPSSKEALGWEWGEIICLLGDLLCLLLKHLVLVSNRNRILVWVK